MLFAQEADANYAAPTVMEAIVQVRFKEPVQALRNEGSLPKAMMDLIMQDYPRYAAVKESVKSVQEDETGLSGEVEINHAFISEDGKWKINIMKNFLALSTLAYTTQEELRERMDRAITIFNLYFRDIECQRVGVRLTHAIVKERLGLQDMLWDDLIEEPFIGFLSQSDVDEARTSMSTMDFTLSIDQVHTMHLHSGLGMIRSSSNPTSVTTGPVAFILDSDFSAISQESIPYEEINRELVILFGLSGKLFNSAATDILKETLKSATK